MRRACLLRTLWQLLTLQMNRAQLLVRVPSINLLLHLPPFCHCAHLHGKVGEMPQPLLGLALLALFSFFTGHPVFRISRNATEEHNTSKAP